MSSSIPFFTSSNHSSISTHTHTSSTVSREEKRVINIDKLVAMSDVKRDIVMRIIRECCGGYNAQLLENTLDAYGLLEYKDILIGKIK